MSILGWLSLWPNYFYKTYPFIYSTTSPDYTYIKNLSTTKLIFSNAFVTRKINTFPSIKWLLPSDSTGIIIFMLKVSWQRCLFKRAVMKRLSKIKHTVHISSALFMILMHVQKRMVSTLIMKTHAIISQQKQWFLSPCT